MAKYLLNVWEVKTFEAPDTTMYDAETLLSEIDAIPTLKEVYDYITEHFYDFDAILTERTDIPTYDEFETIFNETDAINLILIDRETDETVEVYVEKI